MLLWDYNIVVEIEYKCKVEHVLICGIHVYWDIVYIELWAMYYAITQL